MTNPFNQSRFRNEHELGNAFKVVQEVHDKLDIIAHVAENIGSVRSGNIELKSDETGKIYWKYVSEDTWYLWGDLTEWFSHMLDELAVKVDNNTNQISQLNTNITTVDEKLDLDMIALDVVRQMVETDRAALNDLSPLVDENTQNITTNTNSISSLVQKDLDLDLSIATIEATLVDLQNRLEALENA